MFQTKGVEKNRMPILCAVHFFLKSYGFEMIKSNCMMCHLFLVDCFTVPSLLQTI
jgi:hypothetical protein